MDDKTHFQINPARYKHLSPSGSTGNENVYTQRQKARRLLWSVCLFNVAARVAFCRSRLVQSCRLRRERSVERLYHIFRLLGLFFFLKIGRACVGKSVDLGGRRIIKKKKKTKQRSKVNEREAAQDRKREETGQMLK